MGVFRKPRCRTGRPNVAKRTDARKRRSKDDVEKAMEGFFNKLLGEFRSKIVVLASGLNSSCLYLVNYAGPAGASNALNARM